MIYITKMLIDIFQKKDMSFDEIDHQEFEKMYLVQGENEKYFYIFIILENKKMSKFIIDFQAEVYSFFNEDYMKIESKNIKLKKGFEKNTTIILCGISDEYNKEVENIEEDLYFFKKQVLNLNKNEYTYIKDEIEENNYLNTIEQNIFDKDLFSDFLSEGNYKYSLAAKLYEKIPFLELNTKVVQRENLDDIIDNSILSLSKDHLTLRDFILDKEEDDFYGIISNEKEFFLND